MKKLIICAAACLMMASCKDNEKNHTTYIINSDSAATAGSVKSADTATVSVAPPMDSASMMKAWQAYMTPGEPHKMMAMSNGTWDEEVKMFMTPGAPPEVMKATATNS